MRVREMSANAIFYNVRGQLAGLRTFRKLYECNGYPKVSDFGIFAFYAPVRKKKQAATSHLLLFLLYRSEPPAQQVAEHVVRVREMSANAIFYNVRGQLSGLRTFRKLYECNGYPKVSDFGIFAFYAPVRKKKQAAVSHLLLFLLYRSEPPAQQVAEHVVRVREMSAKATNFAGFPIFRCLFAFSHLGKATFFGYFLDFGCLSSFLAALKATDFAGFPILRCLFAFSQLGKATFFGYFHNLRCLFESLPSSP